MKYSKLKQKGDKMNIEFAKKMSAAYSNCCKSLCKEIGLPQTAFDILLFLGNNPDYRTASEIVEIRKIKANLVSVNVEKLVGDGYLERWPVAGDRRKTELICTDKALPIIERGQQLQEDFKNRLLGELNAQEQKQLDLLMAKIDHSLDRMLEGGY